MIYITGATGSIGKELSRLLAEDKIPARAMCRKPEQRQHFDALGLESVVADFNDSESLLRGMQGCTKLFLLTSPDQDHSSREMRIIDFAIKAGVKHIVGLSTANTNLSAKLSYAKSHAEIDHYLRAQPVQWTILRPTGFMQNVIESAYPISKGIFPHMIGQGQLSYIDLRDIALVAKQVLTEDVHHEATYYLTGPESIAVEKVATILSSSLGHPIKSIETSEADMRKSLGYAGLSAWHIDTLIDQFITVAGGYEIDTTHEVKRLTGQMPRTFSQFAMDYKLHFLTH
jgi:uncharacterized protein YbjT (DUF2867 family)